LEEQTAKKGRRGRAGGKEGDGFYNQNHLASGTEGLQYLLQVGNAFRGGGYKRRREGKVRKRGLYWGEKEKNIR